MFSSKKKLQVRDYETDELLDGDPSEELIRRSTEKAGDGTIAAEFIDGLWQPSNTIPAIGQPDPRRAVYVSDRILREGEPHLPGGN